MFPPLNSYITKVIYNLQTNKLTKKQLSNFQLPAIMQNSKQKRQIPKDSPYLPYTYIYLPQIQGSYQTGSQGPLQHGTNQNLNQPIISQLRYILPPGAQIKDSDMFSWQYKPQITFKPVSYNQNIIFSESPKDPQESEDRKKMEAFHSKVWDTIKNMDPNTSKEPFSEKMFPNISEEDIMHALHFRSKKLIISWETGIKEMEKIQSALKDQRPKLTRTIGIPEKEVFKVSGFGALIAMSVVLLNDMKNVVIGLKGDDKLFLSFVILGSGDIQSRLNDFIDGLVIYEANVQIEILEQVSNEVKNIMEGVANFPLGLYKDK